jgi:hypothetical protein
VIENLAAAKESDCFKRVKYFVDVVLFGFVPLSGRRAAYSLSRRVFAAAAIHSLWSSS